MDVFSNRTSTTLLNGSVFNTNTTNVLQCRLEHSSTITKTKNPWSLPLRPLPFSYRHVKLFSFPGYMETAPDAFGYSFTHLGQLYGFAPTSWGIAEITENHTFRIDKSVLIDRSINKALNDIKDQKVNFAQAFAERQQVADLILDSATRIISALKDVKKGRFSSARRKLGNPRLKRGSRASRRLDKTSQDWLALQYGWKPLLSDVYSAAELLALKDEQRIERYHITSRGKAEHSVNLLSSNENFIPAIGQRICYQDTGTEKIIAKCKLTFLIRNLPAQRAASFGLTNPAMLAWELFPFSFVVDWFYPLGDYLNNLDATLGCDFIYGHQSHHSEFSKTRIYFLKETSGRSGRNFYKRIVNYKVECSGYSGIRNILKDFPSPILPSFTPPFTPTRALNALALLQLLK